MGLTGPAGPMRREEVKVADLRQPGSAADIPQLWEVVLARIRDEILAGQLAPGTRLIETELAARFGMSRGPVRDALRELAREGLVADVPRRGTVVATLTANDLAEVYGVREALESGASRIVIQTASEADLDALGRHVAAIEGRSGTVDYLAVADEDFAFHRGMIVLTRNARLVSMNDAMLAQTALLLRTAARANSVLRTGMDRPVHGEIVRALRSRDVAATRAAIENHYRYAEERLFPTLADHHAAGPPGGGAFDV